MRFYKYIIVVVIISLSFFGCKKYPEDNVYIEWQTVHKRLIANYYIEKYLVNGTDLTSTVPATSLVYPDSKYMIAFWDTKDAPKKIEGDIRGRWELTKSKKQILIDVEPFTDKGVTFNPFPTSIGRGIFWEIKKLTKTELWLKGDYASNTYEIYLKRD